jgi:hypothetical protein
MREVPIPTGEDDHRCPPAFPSRSRKHAIYKAAVKTIKYCGREAEDVSEREEIGAVVDDSCHDLARSAIAASRCRAPAY